MFHWSTSLVWFNAAVHWLGIKMCRWVGRSTARDVGLNSSIHWSTAAHHKQPTLKNNIYIKANNLNSYNALNMLRVSNCLPLLLCIIIRSGLHKITLNWCVPHLGSKECTSHRYLANASSKDQSFEILEMNNRSNVWKTDEISKTSIGKAVLGPLDVIVSARHYTAQDSMHGLDFVTRVFQTH